MLRRIAITLIVLPMLLIVLPVLAVVGVRAASSGESFVWQRGDNDFGGFSAISVTPDGLGLTAISDRGKWISGIIQRDTSGTITQIDAGPMTPLLRPNGAPSENKFADSEGLAIAPDGTAFVSFELYTRIQRYDDLSGVPTLVPPHPDFQTFPINGALEALAIDDSGALYTIPEQSADRDTPFPVYRFDGTWQRPFDLPRRGRYLIAGADIFEGRLYVLERAFYGVGFASRVRRFDMNGGDETTLMQSRLGQFDNLEGISVWRDGDEVVLTMISDDNFIPLQQTQIVEHRIPD